MHDPADEGIHGNQALSPQFAKRHMNGPLILTDRAQTIERQIEALADAHAGVPEEQQRVAEPIVAPQQFLLDQLIVLGVRGRGRQWSGRGISSARTRRVRSGTPLVQASSSRIRRRRMT